MGAKVTLDTHSLVWFLDKDLESRLSKRALQTIRKATETGIVYIPTIVLIETLYLTEKGRVNLSFDSFISAIRESENYKIVPFDTELLEAAIPLKGLEIHDRLILATSILTSSVLVSKDKKIKAKDVNVVW
jgi:PIN domain nuclease of toxin-antitoxin system